MSKQPLLRPVIPADPHSISLGSSSTWEEAELKRAFRSLVAAREQRLGLSRGEAVQDLCQRLKRKRNTIFGWLSDGVGQNTIPWHVLDLLRIEEAAYAEAPSKRNWVEAIFFDL